MTFIFILIGAFVIGFVCQTGLDVFANRNKNQKNSYVLDFDLQKLFRKILSFYLLLRIGIMGGTEIMGETWSAIAVPVILAIGLSIFMALATALILQRFSTLEFETRISLAVHYGSVSMGTFAAVLTFLQSLNIGYEPYVTAWVAIMEFPAILLGILILGKGVQAIGKLIRQDVELFLLPVAFIVGALLGKQMLQLTFVNLIFNRAFEPLLVVYLLLMGCKAGENLRNLAIQHWKLICIGIFIPVFGGTFAAAVGRMAGLGLGETTILATLTASASYVAAPALMSSAIASLNGSGDRIAQHAVSVSLASAVGVTLPFNILLGLRIYLSLAEGFQNRYLASGVILIVLGGLILTAIWESLPLGWVRRNSSILSRYDQIGGFEYARLGKVQKWYFGFSPYNLELVVLSKCCNELHLDYYLDLGDRSKRSRLNSREPP